MRTEWREDRSDRGVTAPVSLIVSAFAPVGDIRRCLTPELDRGRDNTVLLLLDLPAPHAPRRVVSCAELRMLRRRAARS